MKSFEYATQIVKQLVDEGHVAFFAGGWVRDYLLGNPSADIDIATDAPPEKIVALFPKTIPVGISFGVVVVVVHGCQFEVSTFRKDLRYEDGRHPAAIELSNPYEDAQRRDFTINGMFYDPVANEVIDYVNGRRDLEQGIVRAIGDPHERFREDRLRMIRAVRFSARFGYPIEEETRLAIRENAHALFPAVALERVWQEFEKMTQKPHFDKAVLLLDDLGLLRVIFPALHSQNRRQLAERVAAYQHFPAECPTIFYLTALFPEAGLEEILGICAYLKISTKYHKLAEYCWNLTQLASQEAAEDCDWARAISSPVADLCIRVVAAAKNEDDRLTLLENWAARKKRLKPHIDRMRAKTPLITSTDLRAEGIMPGRKMGQLLKEAERISVNKDLHQPSAVMASLKMTPLWDA